MINTAYDVELREELLEQRTLHTWHGGEVTFVFMPPRDSLDAADRERILKCIFSIPVYMAF
jgi:hypothetical protein